MSKNQKCFSFRESPLLPLRRGALPLDLNPLAALPQTTVIGSATALAMGPCRSQILWARTATG